MRNSLAILFLLFGVSAAHSEAIVVQSFGSNARETYPQYSIYPLNTVITLLGGDQVRIIVENRVLNLRGPGRFRLTAQSRRSAASSLARAGTSRRVGVARGVEPAVATPQLYDVDVTQAGSFCFTDLDSVSLWRPDTDHLATLSIVETETGAEQSLVFVSGQHRIGPGVWRANSLDEGSANQSTFQFTLESNGEDVTAVPDESGETEIMFTRIEPDENAAAVGLAQLLAENGCFRQVTDLADELSAE